MMHPAERVPLAICRTAPIEVQLLGVPPSLARHVLLTIRDHHRPKWWLMNELERHEAK